jgi:hypothetical protein
MDNKYYYHNGEDKIGPLSLQELKNQNIDKDTYIWHDGLSDWKLAGEIPELQELFLPEVPKKTIEATPSTRVTRSPKEGQGRIDPKHIVSYKAPRMGALKFFSIVGLIFSIMLVGAGQAVVNISGYCYDSYSDCSCWTDNSEQQLVLGFLISFIGMVLITHSIISMVKAFKNYRK